MEDTHPYTTKQQNHANPSKFNTHFLYKAAFVSVFLVILPLLPSQPPDFINQARSWELLQLIFVGIAVSYGLFSKKNEETDKEIYSSKFDNAHSYVSTLLQVSSVFDDENENPSDFGDTKIQTWNSQYYRGEPMVVVANETSVFDGNEKPLYLPIRSLKTSVCEPDMVQSNTDSINRSVSKMGSKRYSNKYRNREIEGVGPLDLEEKNGVLGSPIPMRSRSGRMEIKENEFFSPIYSVSPTTEESEYHRHPEFEYIQRQKIYHKSPPPSPPTPPLPPQFSRKPPRVELNSSVTNDGFFNKKDFDGSDAEDLVEVDENLYTDRFMGESFCVHSKESFSEYEDEEMEEVAEEMDVEADEDWETEEEDNEFEEQPQNEVKSGGDGGPDVDKKADEFIAKFREQIKLQRTVSTRKSSRLHLPKKSLR